jgi:hypothetical protein
LTERGMNASKPDSSGADWQDQDKSRDCYKSLLWRNPCPIKPSKEKRFQIASQGWFDSTRR